jgi:hypothetical protein
LWGTAASCSTSSLLCALSRSQKRRQPRQNPPPSQLFAKAAEAASERRYLTVMFRDLVDSTGIAARLDAEEWLVNAYLENASAAVTEMGARVARKLGGRVPRQLQHAPHLDIGIVRAEQRSKNCKTFNPVLASPGILLSNFKWLGTRIRT